MSILQISKIQVRRGKKNITGIPQLASGEFGWAVDTQELFIGNGAVSEGAPYVGNTKILTEHDNLIDLALFYEYKRNDTTISTGETSPVSRSFQDRLDDQVSVKAFGVTVFDGSIDYTAKLQRAIDQLFINPATKNLESSRVVLEIPAGLYTITRPLKIPSYANITGAGKNKTIIIQSGSGPVFETVGSDSTPGDYKTSSFNETSQPKYINVLDLTFRQTVNSQPVGMIYSTRNSLFQNVRFDGQGIWDFDLPIHNNEFCVNLVATSSSNINYSCTNNLFENCEFSSMSISVYSTHDIEFNTFNHCEFTKCGRGIIFGTDVNPAIPGKKIGPKNNKFTSCVFKDINQQGILVKAGTGNVSQNNKFLSVGNESGNSGTAAYPVIEFGQAGNISDNDYFERSVDLTSGSTWINSSSPYIGEYAGHVIGNHKFNNSVTLTGESSAYKPLLRLSGFIFDSEYQITNIDAVTYEIEYVYQSLTTNSIRSGSLHIALNNSTGVVSLTDEYNFTSTNSALSENLKFSVEFTNRTIILRYSNPSDTGTLSYQYRVFS